MSVQPFHLCKRDSLLDFDNLPSALISSSPWHSLKFIDQFPECCPGSQDCPMLPPRHFDRFSSELEEIAFGNRATEVAPIPSEKDLPEEDLSTSVHSQVAISAEVQPAPVLCVSVPSKKGGCNCKKTGCLKMYCECFSSGKMCGPQCNCCNCSNHSEHIQSIEQAKEAAKHRLKRASYDPLGPSVKRCNCKRTQCQKKYCQCYNVGQKCTELCRCQDCLNGTHSPQEHDEQQLVVKLIF